jgi:endonuclease-3
VARIKREAGGRPQLLAVKPEPAAARGAGKAEAKPAALPYPHLQRPTPAECRAAVKAMAAEYGLPSERAERKQAEKARPLLDSLVGTILSQNTTDVNSHRAFVSLKQAFPTWRAVLDAGEGVVEEAIRSGGLADIKAARIKTILQTVVAERGLAEPSMEYLWELSTAEVKAELGRFKGVGPKTVSCVLMFTMRRSEFPVDTHVWKLAARLGWVPKAATRETTYDHLNHHVPAELKYDLHCLLVEHGKVLKNELGCLRVAGGGGEGAKGKAASGTKKAKKA